MIQGAMAVPPRGSEAGFGRPCAGFRTTPFALRAVPPWGSERPFGRPCGGAHAIRSCQATRRRLVARRIRSITSAIKPMQMMPT